MAPIYGIRVFKYDMACYRTIVMGGVVLHWGAKKGVFFSRFIFLVPYRARV